MKKTRKLLLGNSYSGGIAFEEEASYDLLALLRLGVPYEIRGGQAVETNKPITISIEEVESLTESPEE